MRFKNDGVKGDGQGLSRILFGFMAIARQADVGTECFMLYRNALVRGSLTQAFRDVVKRRVVIG